MENQNPKPQDKELPAFADYPKTNILKNKFFLGFVAFSVLAAFLIGGFALGKNANKPTPTPKTSIRTNSITPKPTNIATTTNGEFINPNGGYSFVVPEGWQASIQEHDPTYTSFGPNATTTYQFKGGLGIGLVKVYPNTPTIDDFLSKETVSVSKIGEATVDGNLGEKVKYPLGQALFIVKNGSLYRIGIDSDQSNDLELFNKLVSSFKFMNLSVDASDWKTYQGKGFSFSYPSDWKISQETNGQNTVTNISRVLDPSAPFSDQIGVGLTFYNDSGNLSGDQFLKQVYYGGNNSEITQTWISNEVMSQIQVGTKTGTKFLHLTGGVGDFGPGVWVSLGKDGLFIKLYGSSVFNQDQIYNKVLSSFKFTQ